MYNINKTTSFQHYKLNYHQWNESRVLLGRKSNGAMKASDITMISMTFVKQEKLFPLYTQQQWRSPSRISTPGRVLKSLPITFRHIRFSREAWHKYI